MNVQQAIEVLNNAVSQMKLTRQEHVVMQEAVSVITKHVDKPMPVIGKEKKG